MEKVIIQIKRRKVTDQASGAYREIGRKFIDKMNARNGHTMTAMRWSEDVYQKTIKKRTRRMSSELTNSVVKFGANFFIDGLLRPLNRRNSLTI